MSLPTRRAAVVVLLLMTASCASRSTPEDEPAPSDEAATVRVVHDLRAATTLTVYLVTPLGEQRRLGSVRPGGTEDFRLPDRVVHGHYTLVGELADGRRFTSRPFILVGRTGVEWSPVDNLVRPLRDS